jgi:hypothetical protein
MTGKEIMACLLIVFAAMAGSENRAHSEGQQRKEAAMPNFVLEHIDTIDVAYSTFSGEGAGEKSNGPLIDLFFKVAPETYEREAGAPKSDEQAYMAWMFGTQFHLPPNIRWLGVRKAPLKSFGPATEYEFWLCYGARVKLPEGTQAKQVCPGLFATLMVDFTGKEMFDASAMEHGWRTLVSVVKTAGIQVEADRPYIEEHMQKPNEGGWGGMKLMLPIEAESLPKSMKNGLVYVKP